MRPLSFSPAMEGTSAVRDSGGSTSSRSDSSCDYEPTTKSHSSHRNRRCFMSKAIHPLSFPSQPPPEYSTAATPQRENRHHLSSASGGSTDLTELPEETFEHVDCFRCGLCERNLSQRSPWSSRRIVKTGDMPVAGVLSCRHVFHAECLDQTTPKSRKNDPQCPICVKIEEENSSPLFSKMRSSFPRLKPFSDDVAPPSKSWGCVQAGDVAPAARNTLLSLNRSRFRKSLSLKGQRGREFAGKFWRSGPFSPQLCVGPTVEHSGAGSSKTTGGSGLK
ncbi:hypothetical protein ABFX02_12G103200 [Erythranthe guttata]